jgi:hypothetical protein
MVGSMAGRSQQGALVLAPRARPAGSRVDPVAPVSPSEGPRLDRRADVLAQMIAARDGFEQARDRRRAPVADALDAYRRSLAGATTGLLLDRLA